MHYFLSEIVRVKSGYLFRSQVDYGNKGALQVIQLKDVVENGMILYDNLLKVDLQNLNLTSLDTLKKGDILFKAKSNRRIAAVIDRDLHNTLATAHYLILRITKKNILPEYIAWYLNQKDAQNYFMKRAEGSNLPVVNKKIISDLDIKVPSIEKQKIIIDIYKLYLKEKQLLRQIEKKRDLLMDESLLRSIF